jgi:hypothetical protein
MGFQWKKCSSKRKILIEIPDVNWRCNFLQKIKEYREDERDIFYIDETLVDANFTFKKCWQNNNVGGILTTVSASNRLIVVYIGSKNRFLEGAGLIFKARTAGGTTMYK